MGGYVLIVESDAERQRQIATALEDAGFDLAAETEAAWAKRSIAARPPDVVLVGTARRHRARGWRRLPPGRRAAA
jgi:DNA-binding response OmpR family regulator